MFFVEFADELVNMFFQGLFRQNIFAVHTCKYLQDKLIVFFAFVFWADHKAADDTGGFFDENVFFLPASYHSAAIEIDDADFVWSSIEIEIPQTGISVANIIFVEQFEAGGGFSN